VPWALDLFGGDDSITPEEFYAYKYDMTYSTESVMAGLVRMLATASAAEPAEAASALPEDLAPYAGQADLEAAVGLLASWDLTAVCLRNIAGRLEEDGRLRGVQGDSYVMLRGSEP